MSDRRRRVLEVLAVLALCGVEVVVLSAWKKKPHDHHHHHHDAACVATHTR